MTQNGGIQQFKADLFLRHFQTITLPIQYGTVFLSIFTILNETLWNRKQRFNKAEGFVC